jgi:hypothetical protein
MAHVTYVYNSEVNRERARLESYQWEAHAAVLRCNGGLALRQQCSKV